MRRAALLILALGTVAGTCEKNPLGPQNQVPVITSLTVFPSTIGPRDSAIVMCTASDPDGDPLVYDWDTDGRLRIKGAVADFPYLYNTPSPTHVFYAAYVDTPIDTAWVACSARDRRGGSATAFVIFVIDQKAAITDAGRREALAMKSAPGASSLWRPTAKHSK